MLKTVHQRCVMRMRVTTMDVRVRKGDAIDPFQLANGFEAVIGYECQERSKGLDVLEVLSPWSRETRWKHVRNTIGTH
jgi:hypothetical protein